MAVDLERINFLAKKSREVGLTEEEKKEQAVLRRAYIDSVLGSLRNELNNTYVLDEKGNKIPVTQYNKDKK